MLESVVGKTELIQTSQNGTLTPISCQLPDYPLNVWGASGTFSAQSNTNVICGGIEKEESKVTNKCFEFSITSLSWKEKNHMKMNRFYHAMTAIDNSVVTCGGLDDSDDDIKFSSCEKFENGVWRDMEPLPIPLAGHCLVTINDTTILSIGGSTDEFEVRNNI